MNKSVWNIFAAFAATRKMSDGEHSIAYLPIRFLEEWGEIAIPFDDGIVKMPRKTETVDEEVARIAFGQRVFVLCNTTIADSRKNAETALGAGPVFWASVGSSGVLCGSNEITANKLFVRADPDVHLFVKTWEEAVHFVKEAEEAAA